LTLNLEGSNYMNRPTNKCIIQKYLDHYDYSSQSVRMRKSSLNYFFGKKSEKCLGYSRHVFDINTDILINYFEFLNKLKNISLTTKKGKWAIIKSFLNFCMEKYRDYNFIVIFPKTTIKWANNHKIADSNKDIILDLDEIKKILGFLRNNNFKQYIILKLLIETGSRLSELLSIQINDLNLEKRYVNCRGKTGEKIYYFSLELAKNLKQYYNERISMKNKKTNALFLNQNLNAYSNRSIQLIIDNTCEKCNITKNISPHTFRRTLNTLRKRIGCDNETAKMLLGHKLSDVNMASYTVFDYEDYIKLFDKYNPYIEI